MIEPTPGRILWFYPHVDAGRDPNGAPLGAFLAKVISDRCVNLTVSHGDGSTYGAQNVPLLQDDDAPPADGSAYACWMPYQKGQAAKHDAPAAASPAIDVGSVTKAMDELAAGTQNKFLQFGSWLHVHVGSLMNRVNALESKPPEMLPHPNDPPPPVPEAGANASIDAAAAEAAKAAAENKQQ